MHHGKRVWFFPDGEMPEATEGALKAHESLIILNPGTKKTSIHLTLYFETKAPKKGIIIEVGPERVKCVRLDNPEALQGYVIKTGRQYAIKLESEQPVIAQYGRLDTTQANMAFYTTPGYAE